MKSVKIIVRILFVIAITLEIYCIFAGLKTEEWISPFFTGIFLICFWFVTEKLWTTIDENKRSDLLGMFLTKFIIQKDEFAEFTEFLSDELKKVNQKLDEKNLFSEFSQEKKHDEK